MTKRLKPPPRKLPWLARLIIYNSYVYATGAWGAIGVGSFVIWLCYRLSRPDLLNNPNVEVSFLFPWAMYFVGAVFLGIGLLTLQNFVFKEGRKTIRLLKYGESATGKWIKSEDENLERTTKALDFMSKIYGEDLDEEGVSNEELAAKMLDARMQDHQDTRIMKYFFVFESKQGTTNQLETLITRKDSSRLKEKEGELILYDPFDPDRAVVYDSINKAPAIHSDGSFRQVPDGKAKVLMLPIIVLLLNIGFFYYCFYVM